MNPFLQTRVRSSDNFLRPGTNLKLFVRVVGVCGWLGNGATNCSVTFASTVQIIAIIGQISIITKIRVRSTFPPLTVAY